MTDKSYPPPCRNFLKPFYLSVTLYACAQRDIEFKQLLHSIFERASTSACALSQPLMFPLPQGAGSTVPCEGIDSSASMHLWVAERTKSTCTFWQNKRLIHKILKIKNERCLSNVS